MYVDIYQEKDGTYNVVYKNDKYQDYVETERRTKLSAIGYAIREIEYIINERSISDYPKQVTMFTENELYDVRLQLKTMEEDGWV